MHLKSALVAGTLALQASAFLVPLEISKAAGEAKAQLESIWSQSTQTVELDCPNCPFFGPGDTLTTWDEDDENKLIIDFAIDHEQILRINNQPMLSIVNMQPIPGPLDAPQVRVADSFKTEPIPIGCAIEISPPVTNEAEPGNELYTVQLTVLDLKGVPVEVDNIKVDLLKHSEEGSATTVSIVKLSTISFSSTPGASSCQNASQWSLCRLRAIIAARIKAMIEATKARAGAAKTWGKGGCKGKKGPFGGHKGPFNGHRGPFGGHKPHGHGEDRPHHGHHGHHGHHHRGHRLAHMLHQTLRFFIVPALLGVIGGLLASAIGMLVGQFIVFMWTRFRRGGRRGNVRIIEVAIEEDEKDALVIDTEELPPQYTDVEAVVVEDEKH